MSEEMEKDLVSEEVTSETDASLAETPETAENTGNENAHWYVVHTYSGYENKVKANLEKTIENRHLENQILEVRVPLQDVVEVKNGARKNVQRKMFPGYVLVNMDMNDETWYVVRNTRGVTGFVGPGSEPVPLTSEEMRKLGVRIDDYVIDVEVDDTIKVIRGAWEGTIAKIKSISRTKETVTIEIDIFGRSTDVEIGLGDIQKLD